MAESGFDPAKNYDDATLAQQKKIEDEITACQPLISDLVSFDVLEKDFENSPEFLKKIQLLKTKYKFFRRTRPDGNCFYRAFGFAYFETLINSKTDLKRFKEAMALAKQQMLVLGFAAFTLEDFYDNFMEMVTKIEEGCSLQFLFETFNDQGMSDYLVVFLRLLVSCHLQLEASFFVNFIDEGRSVIEFCQQEVEPMGKESDNIHVIALTFISGVPVCVARMDQGEGELFEHCFPEDSQPSICLLYRPGHYDILYSK